MGRSFAGVLGPLAFAVIAVRGLVRNSAPDATLLAASGWLLGYAMVGYVVGELAGWIVEDSVRASLATEVVAKQEAHANAAGPRG